MEQFIELILIELNNITWLYDCSTMFEQENKHKNFKFV